VKARRLRHAGRLRQLEDAFSTRIVAGAESFIRLASRKARAMSPRAAIRITAPKNNLHILEWTHSDQTSLDAFRTEFSDGRIRSGGGGSGSLAAGAGADEAAGAADAADWITWVWMKPQWGQLGATEESFPEHSGHAMITGSPGNETLLALPPVPKRF